MNAKLTTAVEAYLVDLRQVSASAAHSVFLRYDVFGHPLKSEEFGISAMRPERSLQS